MTDLVVIGLTVLLLAANAFFVAAEFALISARHDRIEALAESGRSGARIVLRASGELSLMLAAAQLGITMCTVGLGALGEPAVAHQLERLFEPLGVPSAALHPIALAIALGIVTVLHILVGEMVPKNIAIAGPERTALWMVPPLLAWLRVMRPIIAMLNWIANRTLRLFRVEPKDELDSAYTPDELAHLIADSSREGLLDSQEHRRLAKTLSTVEQSVADVLVPLDRLTTVPAAPVLGDIERAVAETGFSRFPLRADDGALVGYLHVKDVLELLGQPPATAVPGAAIRPLPEVSAQSKLDVALAALRRARSHLARAVGPDGSTVGVVALEDLVEEYVGTVRDGTHVPRG